MHIKNWSQFQHFKDRKPPWIKLYREILDDLEWHELEPKAAKVLVMLWLIASEDNGNLPDIKRLCFRLRLSENELKSIVSKLSHWLEHDDINVISERYRDDDLETEEEADTETKKEKTPRKRVEPPDGVSDSVWQDFLAVRKSKRAPMTASALEAIQRESDKAGWSLEDALRECCARGWQGFKADWVADKPKPMTYAQQAADVARVTVPAKQGPDPALQKIIADQMKAVPPPADVREKLAALRQSRGNP